MNGQQLMVGDAMQANLGFVLSQTTFIETGVYRARYPAIRYPGLIPVDYSAPEWIKTITYYSMDVAGRAEWLADRASDIPVVGTNMESANTDIYMAGIGYDYGLEEVNQAIMLGMNLPGERAATARQVYERTVDNIAFLGDVEKGWKGLFNSTAVTAASAPTGNWATATEDQILADINDILSDVYVATNEIAMADTLLLPSLKFQQIASKRLGDGNGTLTILEFIQRANVYTAETGQQLKIRGMRGLNTAGAGGTARMVAYRNSSEVLKMHIPMRHRFLPVQIQGLTFKIPGIFRLGGLDIRLPKEVRYSDGI
ncbi:putative capsid protein [Rhizobium phage RHph_I72]|nr:putative capsid protein [Rhizobium phage RHph_I65]QIG76486.1 putative capsid protein [Rhizobium phage RHph_I72]